MCPHVPTHGPAGLGPRGTCAPVNALMGITDDPSAGHCLGGRRVPSTASRVPALILSTLDRPQREGPPSSLWVTWANGFRRPRDLAKVTGLRSYPRRPIRCPSPPPLRPRPGAAQPARVHTPEPPAEAPGLPPTAAQLRALRPPLDRGYAPARHRTDSPAERRPGDWQ